jgi:hypothetical protein
MEALPNLCYTIALDHPGQDLHRRMARLLATSLLRTRWRGKIVVFRNDPQPVLPEGHPCVEEVCIDEGPSQVWHETMALKYRLAARLDLGGVGKVLFLDCDCLVLRSLDWLMFGGWDIYTAPEPGRLVEFPFNGYLTDEEMARLKDCHGINAGVLGVRASCLMEVMTEWQRLCEKAPTGAWHGRDQHAWNRLLLDTPLRQRHFEPGEVQFPFLRPAQYGGRGGASIVHAAGLAAPEKFAFLYGLWMEAFGRERMEHHTAFVLGSNDQTAY